MNPQLLANAALKDRPIRIVRPGDAPTNTRIPGRANIYLTDDGRVARVEIEE